MKQRPKPIHLRPISREMKLWRLGFMIAFVSAVGFGWYTTVGKSIGSGVKNARAQITDTISQTAKTATNEGNPIAPAEEKAKQLNDQFHEGVQMLKNETVKEEIYQNLASQIKYGKEKK